MNKTLLAHIAAAIASLSAGASLVATRFVVGETDPLSLVFYRYLVGSLCLAPFLPLIWPKVRIPAADLGKIALLGLLFFGLFPWLFNLSLQFIPAGRGAVGLATIPIQTLILAVLLSRERLTAPKLIGVLLAFAGVSIVFGQEALAFTGSNALLGDMFMLLAAFCGALYSVSSRPILTRHGPLLVTSLAMMIATAALFPLVVFLSDVSNLPEFSTQGWIAVLFLGVFGGAIQFSLYTWALRWLPPTTTALYLTLNPLSAMVLGVLLLNEALTLVLVAGLLLVLTAILIANGIIPIGENRPKPASRR